MKTVWKGMLVRALRTLAAAVLVCLCTVSARAQEESERSGPWTRDPAGTPHASPWFELTGEERTSVQWVDSFAASPEGDVRWNPGATALERLRLRAAGGLPALSLHLEGDLFYGTLAGGYPLPGSDATHFPPEGLLEHDSFVPRAGFVEWMSPVGMLRVGHQTSQWGMGLIANGGEEGPMELFSQRLHGDTVERVLFVTRPLGLFSDAYVPQHLYLALAYDLVYKDENASLLDGDRATQYVGTLFFRDETLELGTYVVYRDQEDDDGDTLSVWAFDVAGKVRAPLAGDSLAWVAAVEAAMLKGETTRTKPWNEPDEPAVLGLGAACDLGVEWRSPALALHLLAGLASGDSDLDDGTVSRFRFDPDFNVGLLLFDHYLNGLSAASIERARDPAHAAAPPEGLDGIPTDGSIENAVYFAPTAVYGGREGLAAAAAVLFAWSTSPIASPYETFAAGGSPTGYLGADGTDNRSLGMELDLSVRYRLTVAELLGIEVRGEGAALMPGNALADADGSLPGTVLGAQGRLVITW